ncbi:MAG: lipid-A-disaccharide synthase [Fusobacteriaceae bacterium]
MKNKIFISTGEVSGDLHASYLVKKILQEDEKTEFYGVVGKHGIEAGVIPVETIDSIAVMGFIEGLKKYSYLKGKARDYVDFIKKERVNKVILVDYGGFNLRFLEMLKKEAPKVEVFYYIPPKLWIWGEKRIEKLKLADHIIVIFPWEIDFYKKHGVQAVYFGNPLSEKCNKVNRVQKKVLLLPGSRKQEIEKIMPVIVELIKSLPDSEFILKLVREEHIDWIKQDLKSLKNLEINWEISLEDAVKNSEMAIATSGTVTLELALFGIPTIVVYKTSKINEWIARYILKVGYISLPNLTLNREVFPELVQKDCNVKKIIETMEKLKNNSKKVDSEIKEIRRRLSGENILESYSKYILKGKKS